MTEAPSRALLVEDESVVRVLARDALLRAGFEVDEAPDGLAALERVEDASRDYDVLFVDLGLPGARGEEIVARTRELRPKTVIVVCTGEPVRQAPPGATLVLTKPYTPRQLASLAKRLIAGRRPKSA